MPITDQDINDLVIGTQRDLGRMKFQQIAQEIVDYEVFPVWFKKDKVQFDSGNGIQRTLMTRLPDVARHVGWAEDDTPVISDLLTRMQIDWRHATTNWSYKRQEMLMNRGENRITNVIEARRAGAMLDMVETLEAAGWTAPSSSDDDTEPNGIPYYIVKNSSTGFNGTAPSGHTTVAGVSSTTHPTWRNYTAQYALLSKEDAIPKLRTMKAKTKFKSPVNIKDYLNGRGERYRLYVNETTMRGLENIGESQNENLGRDIASVDGVDLSFKRHPIREVAYLDNDSTNPIYFIDHSTWYPVCLAGDYLRESDPIRDPDKHDWFTVYVDLTYNYVCVDRRRNGVINTA